MALCKFGHVSLVSKIHLYLKTIEARALKLDEWIGIDK